jgi:hypothetical protein
VCNSRVVVLISFREIYLRVQVGVGPSSHCGRYMYGSLVGVKDRISISWEDRRPKLLETGAVGRVQGYKRDQQESVHTNVHVNMVLLLLLLDGNS